MARARNTGGAGLGWVAVLFGIGFGFLLVLSIVLYVQLSGARSEIEEVQQDLNAVATQADLSDEQVAALMQNRSDGTVVGQLQGRAEALREVIGVSQDISPDALREQLASQEIQGSLMQEIDRLNDELDAARQRLEQTQQALQQQQQAADAAQEKLAAEGEQYQQSRQELDQRMAEAEDIAEKFIRLQEQMEQELTQNIEQQAEEHLTERRELEQRVEELRDRTSYLEGRLVRLRNASGSIEAPEYLEADGAITSLMPQAKKVLINLGRKDHVVPGMTFEVFAKDRLVKPTPEHEGLRGKASIEVIKVNEDNSVARVVRTSPRRHLVREDKIINAVYDPDTTYTFRVYGQFDLDGDGESSDDDRERLENLIREWGGKLSDDLDYEVDFLVLGQEPPLPEALRQGTIDPVKVSEHAEAVRNYEAYQELTGQARDLSIPILNQNRFLRLVGYYQR
ncbi:MAG: hypothetical protein ACOCTI_01050 [Phycisphaeraceae bacterium]